jgi:hypothetical protein
LGRIQKDYYFIPKRERYLEEIKVVFSIFDDSHLLNQIDIIETYPIDFEVTLHTSIKGI